MSHTSQSTAEKYQLKWHSHQSNINSSVSNLFKNDKYADVMLLTSNSDETYAIPAHKIILGASSHYFSSIFESNPTPLNSIIYIVLPPELTKRSIQTLIQYIYCGESTVSNDILNEVLRGGELLKIRGLWRNHGQEMNESSKDVHSRQRDERNSIDKQQYAEQRIVQSTPQIISQESPVIVMSPHTRPPIPVQIPPSIPTINIKKDIAIDPGDQNRAPPQMLNYDMGKGLQNNQNKLNEEIVPQRNQILRQYSSPKATAHRDLIPNDQLHIQNTSCMEKSMHPDNLGYLKVKDEPVEWAEFSDEIEITKTEVDIAAVKPEVLYRGEDSEEDEPDQVYSPLTCELCSETFTVPADWVRHIQSHAGHTSTQIPKKRKHVEDEEDDITAALKCDLCSTYFVTPAEWVRHVQSTHTETELAISNNSTVPKRNKTCVDQTPMDKSCSMCNKSFPSYASMVIHRRTHTGERPFYCDICNKGFNVKSNLLRHMRTLHNQQGNTPVVDQQDSTTSE